MASLVAAQQGNGACLAGADVRGVYECDDANPGNPQCHASVSGKIIRKQNGRENVELGFLFTFANAIVLD